ncbi:MAG: MTH1187 family thiamine-binding protein [Candidatus Thermoplasmatota archaeon]|nr:MTH1187 family thiamine-binding protein [Candidatus Thermoplasmatota archaeon]
MILAQLSISPLGVGTSVGHYVKKVVKILENEPVTCYTNAMATVIEAETTEQIFTAVKHAHDALIKEPGIHRVITELKIDHRTDKDATAKSKINAVR